MKNKQTGFTLLELMITVGIIAIIASVAISNFGQNAIVANRTDGRATLLETANVLEKCKAIYGTYTNNCSITASSTVTSKEGLYSIRASTLASNSFELTASPVSGRSQASDTDCTSIILNNLGEQTGTGANSSECW